MTFLAEFTERAQAVVGYRELDVDAGELIAALRSRGVTDAAAHVRPSRPRTWARTWASCDDPRRTRPAVVEFAPPAARHPPRGPSSRSSSHHLRPELSVEFPPLAG